MPKSRFETFAEDLRVYRNKVPGHVLKERFDDYPLDEFYSRNHVFVVWLISEAQYWWKSDYAQLANHPAIRKFSEVLTFGQRNVAKNDA
ncbi:hypothetical protein ACOSZP_18115 [Vibrio fluvialis]|uniref:hypothetical protein n=1 Tax=Vibrio fluvialis TaxID=676 RepID=UPI003B9DF316